MCECAFKRSVSVGAAGVGKLSTQWGLGVRVGVISRCRVCRRCKSTCGRRGASRNQDHQQDPRFCHRLILLDALSNSSLVGASDPGRAGCNSAGLALTVAEASDRRIADRSSDCSDSAGGGGPFWSSVIVSSVLYPEQIQRCEVKRGGRFDGGQLTGGKVGCHAASG